MNDEDLRRMQPKELLKLLRSQVDSALITIDTAPLIDTPTIVDTSNEPAPLFMIGDFAIYARFQAVTQTQQ